MRRQSLAVELGEECRKHVRKLGILGVCGIVGAVAVVPAGAVEEGLDADLTALGMRGNDVGIFDGGGVDALLARNVGDGLEPIAKDGCLLEIQALRGLIHFRLQLRLDLVRRAAEKAADLVDDSRVVVTADSTHARRRAALDLVLQARPRAVGEDRIATTAQRKCPKQRVQGLVHGTSRRKRSEVVGAVALAATMLTDHREGVAPAQIEVGKALVVAQDDIERRAVALDEVGLEQQRLDLARGGDELHSGGKHHHALQTHRKRLRLGVGDNSLP